MDTTPTNKKGRRFKGTVVSDAMEKTIVVQVESFKKDPKYKKYRKHSKRLKVHDETNAYKKGDVVEIEETRPISKEKHFKVVSRM